MEIATTPPSGIAVSWLRSATVCGPAFQAWTMRPLSSAADSPPTCSLMKSMPGDSTSRS
jgi:hypothetical protein